MGLGQTAISVCNDGNVSQLDVTDKLLGGPYYRIEVYRCSQPSGGYGVTASGSRVEYICGKDHLAPSSHRIFRYTWRFRRKRTPFRRQGEHDSGVKSNSARSEATLVL